MLKNYLVLITGGTGTLGRAMVLKLCKHGAKVIFTYNENENAANKLVDDVHAFGGQVEAVKLNLLNANDIKQIFEKIKKEYKKIDALINNAGIGESKPTIEISYQEWEKTVALNLTAPFLCIQNAIPLLKNNGGGKIINIASVAALTGGSFGAHYGATKAGLIGLSKSVARDYGEYQITSNVIAPGPIQSEMTDSLGKNVVDNIINATPQRRLGYKEEVAETVCQLLNPEINYINGQTIVIDGGRYMV